MSFAKKVVVITGSSGGIGQAAAYLFAKEGASVTIHGRSEEKLAKTIKLIEEHGGSKSKVLSVIGEITDPKVQSNLINKTVEKFGKIDVLINNAGIMQKPGADARSIDNLNYTLNVNLNAPIAITELAIPHLAKTQGNVINVSSIGGQRAVAYAPFYAVAKAGLDHFARNYASLLSPQRIRVNNLAPGLTDTEFGTRHGVPEAMYKQLQQVFVKSIPLGRSASSEEMARYLLFIASDTASYMTGQVITADGGAVLGAPSTLPKEALAQMK